MNIEFFLKNDNTLIFLFAECCVNSLLEYNNFLAENEDFPSINNIINTDSFISKINEIDPNYLKYCIFIKFCKHLMNTNIDEKSEKIFEMFNFIKNSTAKEFKSFVINIFEYNPWLYNNVDIRKKINFINEQY